MMACVLLSIVATHSFVQPAVSEDAAPISSVSDEIESSVSAILAERYEPTRWRLTEQLSRRVDAIIAAGREGEVSDDAIGAIALLLDDRNTSLSACFMLAKFGHRARSAIPAIERAITEMEVWEAKVARESPLQSPVNAAGAMRSGLSRIRE